jgi:hypothetical protein
VVDSLKKGNLTQVTMNDGDKKQKFLIEANPKDKTINIYDSNMQRLDLEQVQKTKQSQGEKLVAGEGDTLHKEGQKNAQKQQAGDENTVGKAEKKRQHMKVS